METVQGEGGIYPADPESFMKERYVLFATRKTFLLILDEIQCGMGRTGAMFAWQHYGIKPDIMTSCQGTWAVVCRWVHLLMTQNVWQRNPLAPGDHGTTYGGNPFVGAAVSTGIGHYSRRIRAYRPCT